MRKNLFYLFALPLMIISCSDSEEEKAKPEVTAISLNQKELTLKAGETHQFKVSHTPGDADAPRYLWDIRDLQYANQFPEGKGASLSLDGTLSSDVGCTLTVLVYFENKDGKVMQDECKVTYTLSKNELYNTFCHGFMVKDTSGILSGEKIFLEPKRSENDTTYLVGFNNDKLWIGTFNTNTKEQLDEWIDTEPTSRTLKVHFGYNDYKEFTIDYAEVKTFIRDGDNTILNLKVNERGLWESERCSILLFRKNGETKRYFYTDMMHSPLVKWYDNSYLLQINLSQEPYNSNNLIFTCLADDGEVILSGKIADGPNEWRYPVSFDEYLNIDSYYRIRIKRKSITTDNTIWSIYLGDSLPYDSRYIPSLIKKEGDIWTYSIKITEYSGKEYTVTYSININDGTATKL